MNQLRPLGKCFLVLFGFALQSGCSTAPPEIHMLALMEN